MGSTTTRLFAGQRLESDLEAAVQRAAANVAQMDADEVAPERLEGLVERFKCQPLRLLREQAQFDVHDGGTTNEVRLVIPFEGNARLFGLAPMGLVGPQNVTAKVVDDDGRWFRVEHTITFTNTFPAGTPPEDVRRWGKDQADYVETVLGIIQKTIERHNSTLPSQIGSWMDARRSTLSSADSLKQQLGEGI
jgi:hypothetical protein